MVPEPLSPSVEAIARRDSQEGQIARVLLETRAILLTAEVALERRVAEVDAELALEDALEAVDRRAAAEER